MKTHPLVILLLAGTALAACQKSADTTNAAAVNTASAPADALPETNDAAAPVADAPAADALPAAAAVKAAPVSDPRQAYAYADRAMATSAAFGDSPPDYTYDDNGVTPWVWTASDNSQRIAEAVPGGERYYYYEPGANQPYYVQDPDYGYAYQGGALTVVFDKTGRRLPPAEFAVRVEFASRYFARAQALRQSASAAQRRPVAAANWNARRTVFIEQQQVWTRNVQANPDWRAYHDQNAGAEQSRWAQESARREAWAAQNDARLGDAARADQERQRAAAAGGPPSPGGNADPPGPPAGHAGTGQPGERGAVGPDDHGRGDRGPGEARAGATGAGGAAQQPHGPPGEVRPGRDDDTHHTPPPKHPEPERNGERTDNPQRPS